MNFTDEGISQETRYVPVSFNFWAFFQQQVLSFQHGTDNSSMHVDADISFAAMRSTVCELLLEDGSLINSIAVGEDSDTENRLS